MVESACFFCLDAEMYETTLTNIPIRATMEVGSSELNSVRVTGLLSSRRASPGRYRVIDSNDNRPTMNESGITQIRVRTEERCKDQPRKVEAVSTATNPKSESVGSLRAADRLTD